MHAVKEHFHCSKKPPDELEAAGSPGGGLTQAGGFVLARVVRGNDAGLVAGGGLSHPHMNEGWCALIIPPMYPSGIEEFISKHNGFLAMEKRNRVVAIGVLVGVERW